MNTKTHRQRFEFYASSTDSRHVLAGWSRAAQGAGWSTADINAIVERAFRCSYAGMLGILVAAAGGTDDEDSDE
jgi:hypothetical protein